MSLLKTEKQSLMTKLTHDECREKGKELAELCQKIRKAEDDEAARRKAIKENIDGLRSDQVSLATVVKEGQEYRLVDVRIELDGETVRQARIDTGEIVFTRPATKEELQQRLHFQVEEAAK
jgi:hypothetical protein